MAKRALPFARVRARDDIALGIVGAAETTEFPPLNAAYCIANAAIGPIMANKAPFSRIVRDKDTGRNETKHQVKRSKTLGETGQNTK